MRLLTTLGLAAIAIMFLGARNAHATPKSSPSGSYRQTCKHIKMHKDKLTARCKDTNGDYHDTELDDADRCVGVFTNIEGQLQCNKESRQVRDGRAPGGSYSLTCRDISVRGDYLQARCQDSGGNWINTSLDGFSRCQSEIVNDNGQLRCSFDNGENNGGNYGRSPGGSYTQTCREVSVRGDALRANCQRRDGGWRDTSLDGYRSCQGDIFNDDGQLRCGGYVVPNQNPGGSVPAGTYAQTCRSITVNGDSLRAECQRSDGQWTWSQLDNYRSCRYITNVEGQLRCGQ